jgi:hypothetical protein
MANIEYRYLEIVQAAATIIIDKKRIEREAGGFDRYIHTILPMECENAVLSIMELFAADNIRNIEIKHPANWWEALKEATAPQMFLDRYPVKYTRHLVDVKAIWQGYKPPTDKYGPVLPYVFQRTLDDTEDS